MENLDVILKLPIVRTFVVIQTIVFCIAPGFYLYWLARPIDFQSMEFFRLAILIIAVNSMVYFSILLFSCAITLIEGYSYEVDVEKADDRSIGYSILIERSALQTNLAITICILFTIFDIFFFQKPVQYDVVLSNCKIVGLGVCVAWTANLFFRLTKKIYVLIKGLFTKRKL